MLKLKLPSTTSVPSARLRYLISPGGDANTMSVASLSPFGQISFAASWPRWRVSCAQKSWFKALLEFVLNSTRSSFNLPESGTSVRSQYLLEYVLQRRQGDVLHVKARRHQICALPTWVLQSACCVPPQRSHLPLEANRH